VAAATVSVTLREAELACKLSDMQPWRQDRARPCGVLVWLRPASCLEQDAALPGGYESELTLSAMVGLRDPMQTDRPVKLRPIRQAENGASIMLTCRRRFLPAGWGAV